MPDPSSAPQITCAVCGYDMRGLSQPRCPECGTAYPSFETLANRTAPPAFERATIWQLPFAFLKTWLQSLFRPASFAKSLAATTNTRAFMFVATCYAFTPLALYFWEFDPGLVLGWVVVDGLYLLCQTLVLTIVDRAVGGPSAQGLFGRWFRLSCYTSGVVVLEAFSGPPTLIWFLKPMGRWIAVLVILLWLISASFCIAEALKRWDKRTRFVDAWLFLILFLFPLHFAVWAAAAIVAFDLVGSLG
ncbi:MAG: hypothetical protein KDA32_07585 [Phycisphaerales bacterium]|nr:hypothetical protein [Phycisphaerales bacterium]